MRDPNPSADLPQRLQQAAALRRPQQALAAVARSLRVTEAELLAAHAERPVRHGATLRTRRLQVFGPDLAATLPHWGPLSVTLGSAALELQVQTPLQGRQTGIQTAQLSSQALRLDCDFRHWQHVFAVEETTPGPLRWSLQVFDAQGERLLSLRPLALDGLAQGRSWAARQPAVRPAASLAPRGVARPRRSGTRPAQSAPAVRQAWLSTRHAQEATQLQTRWGLSRLEVLQLADPVYVRALETGAPAELLLRLAQACVALRLDAERPGLAWQWHGHLPWVGAEADGLRAASADTTLRLHDHGVEGVWYVVQPTRQGLRSSLELFDPGQRPLLRLCGDAPAAAPEPLDWRSLLASTAEASHVAPCSPHRNHA